MTADRPGDWFQTYTGKQLWVLDPRPEDICIEDVAHSLSMLCRFNGHCQEFYSVAQHSVFVSQVMLPGEYGNWIPAEARLEALLHDAAEAYVGDMIRPLKLSLGPEFKRAEERVAAAARVALMPRMHEPPPNLVEAIKHADMVALATEKRDMVAAGVGTWKIYYEKDGKRMNAEPASEALCSWSPVLAKERFLARYHQLRVDVNHVLRGRR